MQNNKQTLTTGLAKLNITLTDAQLDQCLTFIELLKKWNKAYNLTAITDSEQMVIKHLLDSLALIPHLPKGSIIDVGSGAGLPGIPLAIALPTQAFTLLDSDGKRTRFCTQAKIELQLKNLTVINQRAEKYLPDHGYDVVLSRAFTNLPEMLHKTAQLCCNNGLFLAMKGQYPQRELEQLPTGYKVEQITELTVPMLNEDRHIVYIKKEHQDG